MALTATVYQRTLRADAWAAVSDTFVDAANFSLAPELDSAVLSRDVGVITEAPAAPAQVTPADLRGEWIRVEITDGTNTVNWYGYCPHVSEEIQGSMSRAALDGGGGIVTIDNSRATYKCYGMGFHLQAQRVDGVYVIDSDNPESTSGIIDRVLKFNFPDRGRNRYNDGNLKGNRSAAKSTGSSNSIYKFDKTSDAQWTALDAAEHLLEVFLAKYGVNYTLAGQHASLANIVDSWDISGMTYLEALAHIISPSRGFTFYFDDTTIRVVTITDTAITGRLGGTVVPANANVHAVTLNTSDLFGNPIVEHVEESHFDQIEVRGNPIRVCASFSPRYSNLAKDWNASDETAFDAETTEEGEQQEKYKDVYSRFIVPQDWNGKMTPATFTFDTATSVERVMRSFNTTTGAINDALAMWHYPDLVFDRTLPLVDADNNQPLKPLAFVRIAGTPDEWHRIDKPLDGLTGAVVRVLDDALGVQLEPRDAKQFSGKAGSDFDYQDIVITASLYTHEALRVIVSAGIGELGEVTKKKVLDVPNAHFWYIAPGTVIDHDGAGTLEVHAGGALRDDSTMLLDLAHLAKAWYGRQRSRIQADYKEDTIPAAGATVITVGHVIKEADIGGVAVPAGTVISSMSYNFVDRVSRWRTEFLDMNLQRFVEPTPASMSERIARIEDNLGNIPVRHAAGGGGGGATVPVKTTGLYSGDLTLHTYECDIHANGTENTSTGTGRVYINQLDTSETVPNGTWFMGTLIGGKYYADMPRFI